MSNYLDFLSLTFRGEPSERWGERNSFKPGRAAAHDSRTLSGDFGHSEGIPAAAPAPRVFRLSDGIRAAVAARTDRLSPNDGAPSARHASLSARRNWPPASRGGMSVMANASPQTSRIGKRSPAQPRADARAHGRPGGGSTKGPRDAPTWQMIAMRSTLHIGPGHQASYRGRPVANSR